MANLIEISQWEAGIYQFETSDPVMGGPNGIDNRPTRELANRTLWLRNKLTEAIESIGNNQKLTDEALALKADKSTKITAGNGLTGGGDLAKAFTMTLGTPSKISATSTNLVSNTSHSHEIDKATTDVAGIVQLENTLTSTADNKAATAAMAKKLNDEKMPVSAINFQNQTIDYGYSGFFLANGAQQNAKALPSMEIHIAHPGYAGARYARGIGFAYGGSFALYTTAWDLDGNYLGMKTVLTEENGVMLTGNQTVAGVKTFASQQDFANGLRVSTTSKPGWGVLAMDNSGVYLLNPVSNKYLKLLDSGDLQYGGEKVFTYSDRSDSYTLDDTSKLATSLALKLAYDAASTPSGQVAFFAGSTAPSGWLKANGAAVSRTTYSALFSAIGTTYGSGDGSTTFNLPDLRGEFIRGFDDGRSVDSGRRLGTIQTDQIKAHAHIGTVSLAGKFASKSAASEHALPIITNDGAVVSGAGTETRPRNIALLACIKI